MLLVALVAVGYGVKTRPVPAAQAQEAAMKAGLDALAASDAAAAVAHFRKVLGLNASHYGATFQLAKALDAAGRPAEARQFWEKARALAEAAKDEETLATVKNRLERPDVVPTQAPQEAAMRSGLDLLYQKGQPAAAAAEFRKVLALNANHYGATYQLATALDRLGQRAEARPLWERVVTMAEQYKDSKTLDTARARLAHKP